MKVRAIKKGYYGLMLHEPNTSSAEFTLRNESDFSKKWMEKVGGSAEKNPSFPSRAASLPGEPKRPGMIVPNDDATDQRRAVARGAREHDKSKI